MNSGINLSDHLPLSFTLNVSPGCVGHNSKLKCSSPIEKSCNWSKVEQHHIAIYSPLICLLCLLTLVAAVSQIVLDILRYQIVIQPHLSNALLMLLPCPYLIIQGHLGALLQVGTMALNSLRSKLIFGTRYG